MESDRTGSDLQTRPGRDLYDQSSYRTAHSLPPVLMARLCLSSGQIIAGLSTPGPDEGSVQMTHIGNVFR